MTRKKQLSPFDIRELQNRFLAGESIKKLAKFYDRDPQTIWRNYLRDFYKKRKPDYTQCGPYITSQVSLIKRRRNANWQEMRDRGHSTSAIADFFGVSQPVVSLNTEKPINGIEDRINKTDLVKLLRKDNCKTGVYFLCEKGVPYAKMTVEVLK
jgi:hypothetical protein